jgi:DNA-binding NarL/FixJ family response regulator
MSPQLQQSTVLVLDDDEFVVLSISRMLKRIPVGGVVSANSVEAGIREIDNLEGEVHAALVDFRMPERHGLQFIKDIRTGSTRAPFDLPCLMLTGHVHPRLLGLAMALNVDAFLEKPAKPEPIRDHLTRVLSERPEMGKPQDFANIDVEHSLEALIDQLSDSTEPTPEFAAEADGRTIDLSTDEPPIGESLTADILNGAGQVLLAAGTVLDAGNLALLKNLMEFDPSVGTIRI